MWSRIQVFLSNVYTHNGPEVVRDVGRDTRATKLEQTYLIRPILNCALYWNRLMRIFIDYEGNPFSIIQ